MLIVVLWMFINEAKGEIQQPELPATFQLIPTIYSWKRHLNSFAINAVWGSHHSNFTLTDVGILQSDFWKSSTHCNNFFSPLYFSGYLPVWNAVCFIYSNPDESSCVHVCRWHILATTWIQAETTVNSMKHACFDFCHLQRTLLEWYASSGSEATSSYKSTIKLSRSSLQIWLTPSEIIWNWTTHILWAYSLEDFSLAHFSFWFI